MVSLAFLKNKLVIIFTLFLIMGGAFIVRSYHFADWLVFGLDQSRDTMVVKEAFDNGPGWLPLLGPRAAGTYLRLGPAEYYFQYLSAMLFDRVDPEVLAYPAFFFSILSIGIFYFLLRKVFSTVISLMTTAVYASSFILSQYARFAWNPNSIPFWGLLFIFCLYQTANEENRKKRGWWLIGLAFSYSVVSQLHFLALAGYPIVAVLFWLFYRPSGISWKYWLGSVVLFLTIYSPLIISDYYTKGNNLAQFRYAIFARSATVGSSLFEKIIVDSHPIATSLFAFVTSFGHEKSQIGYWLGLLSIIFGLGYLAYLGKKEKKFRPLAVLIFSWFFVFLALYFKTDSSLKPRFIFPIVAIPFIFFALFLRFMLFFNRQRKVGYVLIFGISMLVIFANLEATYRFYAFLAKADDSMINRKMLIKQADGITLGGLKLAANYMVNRAKGERRVVCFDGPAEYKRSMKYLIQVYFPGVEVNRISVDMAEKNRCLFFAFARANKSEPSITTRYEEFFPKWNNKRQFAGVAVWDIYPNNKFFVSNKQPVIKNSQSSLDPDNLSEEGSSTLIVDDEISIEEELELTQPEKVERAHWRDIF